MCRVLQVTIVAPPERQLELRRAISSLEYEVTAAVAEPAEVPASADVVLAWEPDDATLAALRERGFKVVAVGGAAEGADLRIDEPSAFAGRVWELFR